MSAKRPPNKRLQADRLRRGYARRVSLESAAAYTRAVSPLEDDMARKILLALLLLVFLYLGIGFLECGSIHPRLASREKGACGHGCLVPAGVSAQHRLQRTAASPLRVCAASQRRFW